MVSLHFNPKRNAESLRTVILLDVDLDVIRGRDFRGESRQFDQNEAKAIVDFAQSRISAALLQKPDSRADLLRKYEEIVNLTRLF